jgi:hypothetical protein
LEIFKSYSDNPPDFSYTTVQKIKDFLFQNLDLIKDKLKKQQIIDDFEVTPEKSLLNIFFLVNINKASLKLKSSNKNLSELYHNSIQIQSEKILTEMSFERAEFLLETHNDRKIVILKGRVEDMKLLSPPDSKDPSSILLSSKNVSYSDYFFNKKKSFDEVDSVIQNEVKEKKHLIKFRYVHYLNFLFTKIEEEKRNQLLEMKVDGIHLNLNSNSSYHLLLFVHSKDNIFHCSPFEILTRTVKKSLKVIKDYIPNKEMSLKLINLKNKSFKEEEINEEEERNIKEEEIRNTKEEENKIISIKRKENPIENGYVITIKSYNNEYLTVEGEYLVFKKEKTDYSLFKIEKTDRVKISLYSEICKRYLSEYGQWAMGISLRPTKSDGKEYFTPLLDDKKYAFQTYYEYFLSYNNGNLDQSDEVGNEELFSVEVVSKSDQIPVNIEVEAINLDMSMINQNLDEDDSSSDDENFENQKVKNEEKNMKDEILIENNSNKEELIQEDIKIENEEKKDVKTEIKEDIKIENEEKKDVKIEITENIKDEKTENKNEIKEEIKKIIEKKQKGIVSQKYFDKAKNVQKKISEIFPLLINIEISDIEVFIVDDGETPSSIGIEFENLNIDNKKLDDKTYEFNFHGKILINQRKQCHF